MNTATLIIASNSIGNPKDIPNRTLEYIRSSDLLVFEEDRPARLLLKTAGVHRDYLKYSEHKQKDSLAEIKSALSNNKTVLYVSDQGCSNLADPASDIIKLAYSLHIKIIVIPGPSSITSAISACPFNLSSFYYKGFLDRDEKRKQQLISLNKIKDSIIILDTPYRLKSLIKDCQTYIGSRRGFLALDISGENEQYLLGSFKELDSLIQDSSKLNFVLIIENL